jgi:hypothetical protein
VSWIGFVFTAIVESSTQRFLATDHTDKHRWFRFAQPGKFNRKGAEPQRVRFAQPTAKGSTQAPGRESQAAQSGQTEERCRFAYTFGNVVFMPIFVTGCEGSLFPQKINSPLPVSHP